MRAFVTGGSGFVGRNLVQRLLSEGHEVVATVSPSENKLPDGAQPLYVTFAGIDWSVVKGCDVVFHQAANNDTRCQDQDQMFKANVRDTLVLLDRLVEVGCTKFVIASSTAVYGNAPAPYDEDDTPISPLNLYGLSKMTMEQECLLFAAKRSVHMSLLRYCNVYGPGEDHKGSRMSMIGQICRSILSGEKVRLFKTGTQRRDWVHVDDAVNCNLLASKGPGGVFNVGSGDSMSFNLIVKTVHELLKQAGHWKDKVEYIDLPFANEYQNYTQCSIKKACALLGYTPSYTIKSGIESYLRHLISRASSPTLERLASSALHDVEGHNQFRQAWVLDDASEVQV